ncbi:MAG: hypothetical protein AAF368_01310 [Planctomycetota bacterium]
MKGTLIREGVIRLRTEIEKPDLRAFNLDPVIKANERLNKLRREGMQLERQSDAERQKSIEASRRADEQRRRALEASAKAQKEEISRQRSLNELTLRGAQNARQLADGAFTAARGFALLGLQGENDLQKVLTTIADIQGKFDLFRGSVDVFEGSIGIVEDFGEAWKGVVAPIGQSNKALGRVLNFIGPGGTIALAAAGTAVAVGLLWDSFNDDAEKAIADTKKRIDELRESSKRIEEERRIRSESAGRLSAIQTDQERLGSITNQLRGIDAVDVAGLREQASALQARQAAEAAFVDSRRAAAIGPRFNPSEEAIDRRQRAIRERDRRRSELAALGGSVSEEEKQLLAGRLQAALSTERSRFGLLDQRRSTFEGLSDREDAERTAGVRSANSELEQRQGEAQRLREQLAAVRRDRQVAANTRLRELDRLSAPNRAFVDSTLADLTRSARDGFDASERARNKRLLKLVPSVRREVEDAETIAAGGTPVARPDRVAEIESRLAEALEKLAEATRTRDERVAADVAADERAESAAERIANAFERSSNRIEQLEGQLTGLRGSDERGTVASLPNQPWAHSGQLRIRPNHTESLAFIGESDHIRNDVSLRWHVERPRPRRMCVRRDLR